MSCCGGSSSGVCSDALDPIRYCEKWYGGSHALDTVDGDMLDGVIGRISQRINDIVALLDANFRDDCTLEDESITLRMLAPDVLTAIYTGLEDLGLNDEYLPRWDAGTGALIDSIIKADGAIATVEGNLEITGKLTVAGLIDPTGLQLDPVAANPGDENTIWLNSGDGNRPYLGGDWLNDGLILAYSGGTDRQTLYDTLEAGVGIDINFGTAIPGTDFVMIYMSDMDESRIKGRAAGAGTGAPTDLTPTQARTILNVEDGAEVNVVDSVFGRTGDVVAAASDYDASQVDNDSGVAGATVKDALDALAAGTLSATEITELNSGGTIDPDTHAQHLLVVGSLGAPSEWTFDTLDAADDGKWFMLHNPATGTADQRLNVRAGVPIWKMADGITLWEGASCILAYNHTDGRLELLSAQGLITKAGVVTYFEGQWYGVSQEGGAIWNTDDLGLTTYRSKYINDGSQYVRTVWSGTSFNSGGARAPSIQFETNNGNRIYAPDSSWWDVLNQDVIDGNQDMCIHVWFNSGSLTQRRVIACHFEDSDNYWEFAIDNSDLYFRRKYSGSFDIELTWTTTVSENVNHHAIVAVIGGKLALYMDGQQRAYQDLSGETAHNFSGELAWGALGNSTTGTYDGDMWDFGICYGNPFDLDPQSDNSDTYTINSRKIGVLNGNR